jgi:hypothetical protein
MKEYITQERALELSVLHPDYHGLCLAAIQAYRDSLVAGELPEPVANAVHKGELVYTADQLRQAIADALAKQDVRAPMFKFRECEDSQAMQEPDYEQSETYLRAEEAKQVPQGYKLVPETPTNDMTVAMANALEDPENERSSWDLAENMYAAMLAAAPDPKEGA